MATAIAEKNQELVYPPEIRQQVIWVQRIREMLAQAEQELLKMIEAFRANCQHNFEKVMKYDATYRDRLDGVGKGQDVFVGRKCKKCGLFEPRKKGLPFEVCYKCGGRMEHNRQEPYGEDTAHVHKCQSCGHEHDTM